MTTLAIHLTLFEVVVLFAVALIFSFAVYFFIKSRKSLREALEASRLSYFPMYKKEKTAPRKKSLFAEFKERLVKKLPEAEFPREKEVFTLPKRNRSEDRKIEELKQTIARQQTLLNHYLGQIEELETGKHNDLQKQNLALQEEIVRLHEQLEKKDAEIEDLYQQASASSKMAARIDEVYRDFEQLQANMQLLEKQAARANTLAIELEDARNAYEVIHKELARKQDKLEEVMEDNRNLKEELNMMEDKLSEANLQRQQLQKKVQFLTDLNNEMQSISETNKKLQTELRRIGELESMLNMMAEERDYLLRKKLGK